MRKTLIAIFLAVLFTSVALILFSEPSPYLLSALGAVAILLAILVRWHARHTAYLCPNCGTQFSISPITDFLSPHKPSEKLLRCPGCREDAWCAEVS